MNCTYDKPARQAARISAGTEQALIAHRAQATATCPQCAHPLALEGEWIICPYCGDSRPSPALCPSEAETLALWQCRVDALGCALTVRSVLFQLAQGHPAGTRHQGYQQHVKNTAALIASGQLVPVGEWYDKPTYAVAQGATGPNVTWDRGKGTDHVRQ